MSAHLREAARGRYGIELTDADTESIAAQCRTGRYLLRVLERHPSGRCEHHAVVVHGVRMPAVWRHSAVITLLPASWLRHDSEETALALAFKRALAQEARP
jgi:hypothetical protein